MTEEPAATVLIAASPGPLRDALIALLLSLPQVHSLRIASLPMETLQTAAAELPELIIVVMESDPAWAELPERIRAAAHDCRVVVLANGESEIPNADLVLQQGARPETLVAALMSMLEK